MLDFRDHSCNVMSSKLIFSESLYCMTIWGNYIAIWVSISHVCFSQTRKNIIITIL